MNQDILLPKFPLPEGFSDSNAYLRHLTYKGAHRRWGEELTSEQIERLNFELATIKDKGVADYFLFVQNLISEGRRKGVQIGPGRGPAAGSAVNYCLSITQIDPLQYGLLFERFLYLDSDNMPSIEIDIDDESSNIMRELSPIYVDFNSKPHLTIIKKTLVNIKKTRGIDVDIDSIETNDPDTYRLYFKGRTLGTFYLFYSGYVQNLQISSFKDLIALSALSNVGTLEILSEFIDRKQGRKPITYEIPAMEKYLKETYGIMVYQEQLMQLSCMFANFSPAESNRLRIAVCKKKLNMLTSLKTKFLEGGKNNGYASNTLEGIWNQWEQYGFYTFNKSAATSYTWLAFQTAYLKAHYPAEYMTAAMNSALDYKMSEVIAECKNMSINVRVPKVIEPFFKFSIDSPTEISYGLY